MECKCMGRSETLLSRIVLTTRLLNVANDCGSSPFMMRFLDEVNSWKLFCQKIFKTESCPTKLREVEEESFENECCPPELREVGGEIVKLCKGLALSIVVMGGLLSKSPRTVKYWKSVLDDIKSISGESLDVLSLSYTHLPAHLKPCFLYMGVFEEDSKIHVSEVIRLWVAEGFIKPNGSGIFSEEIGERYVKDLIERNLVLAGKRDRNGKVKSIEIHDLLRDLCIKLGEQQQFFYVSDNKNTLGPNVHRLIGRFADYGEDQLPLTRSIVVMSLLCGQPIKKGLLRVYKNSRYVDSPKELYRNVNLRHLAHDLPYHWPRGSSWELPTRISMVWNLQSLIIEGFATSASVVAPAEIWKMRQLRHVVCPGIYLPPCNRHDEDELENLQTLKKTLNLMLCREVCKMIPNIIKLCLLYDDELHGYDDSLVEYLRNLDRMYKLESLKLVIQSRRWRSRDAELMKKLTFPNCVKKLSLEGCGFDWDDLTMIGLLPQLEVLFLGRESVSKGDRWSPVIGQFLRLKVLIIYDTERTLEYWDADESNFPVLEELILASLEKLEEIPSGIGDIPTLELIRVNQGSMSLNISAVKMKEDQLDMGNDTLQVESPYSNQRWRISRKGWKQRTSPSPTSNSKYFDVI